MSVRVALAQVDCVLGDVEANVATALTTLVAARERGAALVVFPELSLSGYALRGYTDALDLDGSALTRLARAAGELWVAVGLVERNGWRAYNSCALLHRGKVSHVQRKLTLPTYGPFEERRHFSPGQALRAFDLPFGRVAVLVCNDAWHPALGFLAAQDGAELLLVPANSGTRRADSPTTADFEPHWNDVVSFLARLLQVHVLFVNRVGREAGRTFYGGSRAVDPDGETLAQGPRYEPGLVVADVDVAAVRRARTALPLQKDARLALVAREIERLIADGGDM